MLKRKQKGFTIVELLIVIVVIAILAAISLVTYSGITQRSYAAKASSIIDGYSKIIQLYKVDNNSYPTYSDIGLGNYACLTPVGSLPPAPLFGADVCEVTYGDRVSAELNGKLLNYVKSLPNGLLPEVQYNATHYARGVSYSSNSTSAQIIYYLNGDYNCPRGDKSSFRAGTTECSVTFN